MIHTNWRREDGKAGVPASNNGRVGKTARFLGRAAHAGGAPHLGVNALYAAQIALTGINAVRETFRDEDSIRVHPILTHGGSQVNVIPGEARLEMYVRGKSAEGVAEASARVDRALRAGALALGAQVEIETLPGPMPLLCDASMAKLFEAAARGLVGDEHYQNLPHRSGSTDMRRDQVGALIIQPVFVDSIRKIVELANRHHLPTVSFRRSFAEAGVLLSYGADQRESWRRAAIYVDKILKGAKPGNLSVAEPTKYELVVNLKTAKLLGLTVPPSVVGRADGVIQ